MWRQLSGRLPSRRYLSTGFVSYSESTGVTTTANIARVQDLEELDLMKRSCYGIKYSASF